MKAKVVITSAKGVLCRVLPRDARSAKRSIAIVSRPSVRPSVTLMYWGRISLRLD